MPSTISSTTFKLTFAAILSVLIQSTMQAPVNSIGQLSGRGRVSGSLSLSSAGADAMAGNSGIQTMTSSATGADVTEQIDFGDISKGTGENALAVIRLRLRGNAPYRLNISESSYSAQSLMVRGNDVSGAQDRGSFVQVRVGTIIGSGGKSNAVGSRPNPQLELGLPLSNISQGALSASSTALAEGDSPSLGGTPQSADNSLEIPVYFSVPTGYEVGPTMGNARGNFQITLQIGAFTGR